MKRILTVLVLVAALAGCDAYGNPLPSEPPTSTAPTPTTNPPGDLTITATCDELTVVGEGFTWGHLYVDIDGDQAPSFELVNGRSYRFGLDGSKASFYRVRIIYFAAGSPANTSTGNVYVAPCFGTPSTVADEPAVEDTAPPST